MAENTGPAGFEINEHTLADPANAALLAWFEAHVTTLRFSALPEDVLDDSEASLFYLMVEMRAPGQWCVNDRFRVLSNTGEWEHEPLPSSRTDDFKARTRFSLPEAIRLARGAAIHYRMAGWSIEDYVAQVRARRAAETDR